MRIIQPITSKNNDFNSWSIKYPSLTSESALYVPRMQLKMLLLDGGITNIYPLDPILSVVSTPITTEASSGTNSVTASYTMILSKSWFDDDLPNILGINPLEAAFIFGLLYYFYGSAALYDFARDAGKAFSTYGPIVKQAAEDIFYEFRDYLEEERERDELRKAGVDVDSLPRRTTNIIERFQQSMEV